MLIVSLGFFFISDGEWLVWCGVCLEFLIVGLFSKLGCEGLVGNFVEEMILSEFLEVIWVDVSD